MSRAAAFFWILVALILGAVVWATSPRQHAESANGPLLPDFSPSSCESFTINWPDGQTAALTRGPLEGQWLLSSANGGQISWPAEPGRVQGLLRLVQELRGDSPSAARGPMPKAIVLTFSRAKGSRVQLAVDPNTLGGKGRVAVIDESSRVVAVSQSTDGFVRSLDRSAVLSWQSTDLLLWPPENCGAFRSASTAGEIDLTRGANGWIMQSPVATRADSGAIQGVLLLLSKSGVDRFLPDSGDFEAGFSPPARMITCGYRRPGTDPALRLEERIEIGPSLDSQTRVVRLSAGRDGEKKPLWGPVYGVVDSSALAALSEVPANFVARISADLAPADISEIRFAGPGDSSASLRRENSGNFAQADSTAREFLKVLCETPAASCEIRPADAPTPTDARVLQLLGPQKNVLKELLVRPGQVASKIAGSPATPALEVIDGRILRLVPTQRPRDMIAALVDASSKGQP
ncbi:MAG: hypothetical protein U0573_13020 [Phycisphaerales bacterium]|nr:hypothetical protein [Planctomycetota bacterium]